MKEAQIWPPSLSQVVRHMELRRLEALASDLGGDAAERVSAYVGGLSARAKADLGGGRDRLAVLAECELGPRLDPALGEDEVLDLRGALEDADVVYFNLHSDRYPAASQLLAAALVIDLVGAHRRAAGPGAGRPAADRGVRGAGGLPGLPPLRPRPLGRDSACCWGRRASPTCAPPSGAPDTLTEQVI